LAGTIALNHPDFYDGSGYPQGLAGEEIPLELANVRAQTRVRSKMERSKERFEYRSRVWVSSG
jgi:response regulator RpfG family c-di-GMP phosphodiesterase